MLFTQPREARLGALLRSNALFFYFEPDEAA
jgi:hypothetical protein